MKPNQASDMVRKRYLGHSMVLASSMRSARARSPSVDRRSIGSRRARDAATSPPVSIIYHVRLTSPLVLLASGVGAANLTILGEFGYLHLLRIGRCRTE